MKISNELSLLINLSSKSCHKLREVLSSTPPLPDLRLPTDVLAPPSDGFYRHQILGILQLLLMMGPSIDMKMHLPFEWIGTGTAEAARTVESGSDPVHRSSDLVESGFIKALH
ncbi:hypothetical protein Q3G72_032008 [Acer saccharum]|nr:hypothetical protein Q3G72_032008 [Acer saccharum]